MPTEVGEVDAASFDNLDELFVAVDAALDCPEASSNQYGFAIPNHAKEFVQGRSCGDTIIMTHSEDPTVITEIQNMMSTVHGGPVPMVHGAHWFVADITEVAEDGQVELQQPRSRDLESLATEWGAVYSTF